MVVALKKPAKMGKTMATEGMIPGIAGKPGKIKGGSALVHASRSSGKRANGKSDARGIDAGVLVLAACDNGMAAGGDGMSTHFADNIVIVFFWRTCF